MKYNIFNDKFIHNAFFKIKEALLQFDNFDQSQSSQVVRYALEKEPAAASIIHLTDIDKYVLVEQFRYPVTLLPGENPWILEIAAGVIEDGHTAEETAIKEIQEEAGYNVDSLELITEIYNSPGISSERIYLFIAKTTSTNVTPVGDPHDDEEDIKVHLFDKNELQDLIDSKMIKDAKTLIAIQYALANY